MPSLAAQPEQFIVTQLFMFREGNRKDPQMSPLAKNLTNADMNDIAAYFSAQSLAPLALDAGWPNNIIAWRVTARRSRGCSISRDSPDNNPNTCARSCADTRLPPASTRTGRCRRQHNRCRTRTSRFWRTISLE